jgi:hypothetical protein
MPDMAYSFVRAGPRPDIRIHPKDVKAAIVTCGGLCPGLNDTVQEIFNCLYCELPACTAVVASCPKRCWCSFPLPV